MEDQVIDNIYQVRIPLPFPLRYVNCYLCRDSDGWSVIDTGVNWPQALAAWDRAFDELGIGYHDIHRIFVTHFHPDHFGLAGHMQAMSGAPVYMAREEARLAEIVFEASGYQFQLLGEMFRRHGMPAEQADRVASQALDVLAMTLPHPTVSSIEEGDVRLGGRRYLVTYMPGHSDAHTCFYGLENRILLAGDHLLVKITPNIGLWPRCNQNPLGSYLSSLHKVARLEVDTVLPGHRALITDMRGRVGELLRHHEERAALAYHLADGGCTAHEISLGIFPDPLSLHEQRFALAETVAHLEWLVSQGRVERVDEEIISYHRRD